MLDLSQPPFCIIRHPQEPTPEDFEALLLELRSRMILGEQWAVLADLRFINPAAAGKEGRESVSKLILENAEFLGQVTVAEARVVSGPIMRGILTVLDWITPRSWPVRNFGNGVLAENWLRTELEAAGIEPDATRVWEEDIRVSS